MFILLGVLAVAAVGILIASLVVAERELKEKTQRLEVLESRIEGTTPNDTVVSDPGPPTEIEQRIAALSDENAQLSAQIDQLKQNTGGDHGNEIAEGLRQRLRDAEAESAHLREEHSRITAQVAGLKKERDAGQEIIRSLEDLQERLPDVEREIAGLKQENSRLFAENGELKSERGRMESRAQDLENRQTELSEARQRIERLVTENSELQQRVADLRHDRESDEEKIRRLKKELEQLPDLNRSAVDLRRANSRLEAQLESMKSSLRRKIESQLAGLQELHHQLENSKSEQETELEQQSP